ncbi:hypothetical protein BD410DRAFT_798558 [Rickenella mellea]|uniref:Uncharacterized protein n=1 Tax=Rickenella mellea TaxID=50990 RepID=A0A4R5XIJ0_9AGAM|nr:hypothetical protein BD410DRAFT_798558 [Rickenella mellea]
MKTEQHRTEVMLRREARPDEEYGQRMVREAGKKQHVAVMEAKDTTAGTLPSKFNHAFDILDVLTIHPFGVPAHHQRLHHNQYHHSTIIDWSASSTEIMLPRSQMHARRISGLMKLVVRLSSSCTLIGGKSFDFGFSKWWEGGGQLRQTNSGKSDQSAVNEVDAILETVVVFDKSGHCAIPFIVTAR